MFENGSTKSPINLIELWKNVGQESSNESEDGGKGEFKGQRLVRGKKCGEIFLDKNYRISFFCNFCFKECHQLENLLRHLMRKHFTIAHTTSNNPNHCGTLESLEEDAEVHISNIEVDKDSTEGKSSGINKQIEDKELVLKVEPQEYVVIEQSTNELEFNGKSDDNDEGDDNIQAIIKSLQKVHNLEKRSKKTIEISEAQKPFICEVCGEEFIRSSLLSAHFNIHKLNKQALQSIHKLKKDSKNKKEFPNIQKAFICELCGQKFYKQTRFAAHLNVHKFGKQYTCQFCDRKFADKGNLNTHVRRHLGIKPYSCSTCDKAFYTSTELKIHIRSHTGEKPFVCKECGKRFVTSSHLINHMREHRNERLFICLKCDKRFNTKHNLVTHELTHSNERPFKCSICAATFPRRISLSTHMKLHSDVKEYVCQICSKAFAQKAGLFSHAKTHHEEDK